MLEPLHAIAVAAILTPPAPGPTSTPIAVPSDTIEAITIHPPVAALFQCSEHPLGAEDHVPDALGADCVVVRRDGGPDGNLLSLYTGDGTSNEDWHSWREPLLAPFDGVVIGVQINPETTLPGVMGSGRSSAIGFQLLVDGEPTDIHVAYVHVREVTVSQGDTVRAGDPVARIGNNGWSFHPSRPRRCIPGRTDVGRRGAASGPHGSCRDGAGEGGQPANGGWSWQTASIVPTRYFVHTLIDWNRVRRRLERYPAIRSAFPETMLNESSENAPYYCHYMAWRLGTWDTGEPFRQS